MEGRPELQSKIVYPMLLEERSSAGRMVVHVHDELVLNLRKASVAAPQLRVLEWENGLAVTNFYNGTEVERSLFEDETKLATVTVDNVGNAIKMKGIVGPSQRIEPMPIAEKSRDGVFPHMISDIEQPKMLDKHLSFKKDEATVLQERQYWGSRKYPRNIEVEVFVVLDNAHHRQFDKATDALLYLCVTVNSANLRFAATVDPHITLVLIGIEKSKEEPYAVVIDNDLFDEGTIRSFKTYALKNKVTYGSPDVVFLMSGRDVFTIHNGIPTNDGLGIGYVSGVCSEFFVALGEDKPGFFNGMHTFTHEIAHTLGAKHDGDDADPQSGHPGAKDCSWDLGHIMSYINRGPSHHQFSTCSLKQIQYVMRLKGETCWFAGTRKESWDGQYPGMTVTVARYCAHLLASKKDIEFGESSVNSTSCRVRCEYHEYYSFGTGSHKKWYRRTYAAMGDALDYMSCGYRMVCIQGVCQYDPRMNQGTVPNPGHRTRWTRPSTSPTRKTLRTTRRFFHWRHRQNKN
ncbi:venom metalloproteinase BumaMPs1-like [Haemaphysalis longicornis]